MLIPSQDWGEGLKFDSSMVKTNLQEIQKNIAHSKVKIIAVTKYFGLEGIIAGYDAGLRDFGESRAKDEALGGPRAKISIYAATRRLSSSMRARMAAASQRRMPLCGSYEPSSPLPSRMPAR